MDLLEAVTAAHHGHPVTVPHDLGTAVGTVCGIDMRDQPTLIVAVDGRDVRVPIEHAHTIGGAA